MRCLILFALLALFATPLHALELNEELSHGLSLMNNGQLREAYDLFRSYKEDKPEDVSVLFLLAMTKWRMMWLSTYNGADRKELMSLLDQLEEICRPALSEDKDDLFYYAAVQGIRAQVAATENEWWDTAKLGKGMKNHAEDLLEKDPEYFEAYYLLGSYNYFADALPGYLKFLRALVFLPGGDRIKGMNQLILAFEKGGPVSAEAGKTLAIIYTFYEGRHDYGIQMCDHLLQLYPESYDIALYRGINLYFSMSWEKCVDWLHQLREHIGKYSSKHRRQNEDAEKIIHEYMSLERETRYWTGRALIQLHRYDDARGILMELADPPIHQPYWLMRWVYLSLAQIEYQKGHAESAERWLEYVLTWKDVKDSQNKAKLLKRKKEHIDVFDIDFR